ncbi:GDSL-type esterase/lipase family protein [Roseateles saccharophilus]|uniref:Lysophospholipase L1-like esterase n=1 Tax=Roseateles saccharophilus TaxID=304 RepID=A0A4V2VSX2_ROSSA|nr:GDSL-type esterase/lipase family protein [Roseateles saccharophilus]MDG0835462.1 1,4-beta-D-glucan glucohydrolase [Roseateles saccharophilus]TCV04010.1 lysophospholipase L1-like esterase [Roseateles saccharophilus]
MQYRNLIASALLAATVLAHAQDLVILPAPTDAWRVTVGHWEAQAELTSDGVVAPAPKADHGGNAFAGASAHVGAGRRDALTFEWRDLWQSMLRIESRKPLDLRPYADGMLEFDLDVGVLAQGGVSVKLGCGAGCERAVNLLEPARGWAGKGWQHVALSMSCFAREGADFSAVTLPFGLEGTGSGRVSVANVRLTRASVPGLACPDYRSESVTPAMLNESWSIDWWKPRHEQKLEEKRQLLAAGTPPEVVFIGDSITQGWEKEGREVWQRHFAPLHGLALGFGGDRTENALWRLQHGEIDGLAPKAVVLMIGTNNSGHRAENPETTAAGIKRLLDEIRRRLPNAQVLLLAIFPRGEKPDDFLRGINQRVNQIIQGYADGRQIHFLDIGAALLQPDGTLSKEVMPDLLHPNERGYEIWQRAMAPTLQQLMGVAR